MKIISQSHHIIPKSTNTDPSKYKFLLEAEGNLAEIKILERYIQGFSQEKRKFWVEIQHAEPFDEKDNPNEIIYIQRRRKDLDNVGEVFSVTEDIT